MWYIGLTKPSLSLHFPRMTMIFESSDSVLSGLPTHRNQRSMTSLRCAHFLLLLLPSSLLVFDQSCFLCSSLLPSLSVFISVYPSPAGGRVWAPESQVPSPDVPVGCEDECSLPTNGPLPRKPPKRHPPHDFRAPSPLPLRHPCTEQRQHGRQLPCGRSRDRYQDA